MNSYQQPITITILAILIGAISCKSNLEKDSVTPTDSLPNHCYNGEMDEDELGADCGGSCGGQCNSREAPCSIGDDMFNYTTSTGLKFEEALTVDSVYYFDGVYYIKATTESDYKIELSVRGKPSASRDYIISYPNPGFFGEVGFTVSKSSVEYASYGQFNSQPIYMNNVDGKYHWQLCSHEIVKENFTTGPQTHTFSLDIYSDFLTDEHY